MGSDKIKKLQTMLKSYGRVLIALSGGVDSSVLLKIAAGYLGPGQVLAATAYSELSVPSELKTAKEIAALCQAEHQVIHLSELAIPEFAANSPKRCYYCKLKRFQLLRKLAVHHACTAVADGSLLSDLEDYRPGMKALTELGIHSPLLECGFTKGEIRDLARDLGLPNWNQPANSCLASRIPYGTVITAANLAQVAKGEDWLHSLGITDCRLRHHGTIARIEVPPSQFDFILEPAKSRSLATALKSLGFNYVTLDLQGLRPGSLNEVI